MAFSLSPWPCSYDEEIRGGMVFPEQKILKLEWYRDQVIPVWMDFPELESSEEEEEGSEEEEEGSEEEGSNYDDEEEGGREEECSDEEGGREKGRDGSEKKMRRKMCRAWILASEEIKKKLKERIDMDWLAHMRVLRLRTIMMPILKDSSDEEKLMMWWKFSAEEELRAGWKDSEIDRLEEISLVMSMKTVRELEQSCATKRLKEAQEKDVQLVEELKQANKNYLEFRSMWIAIHSCWGGAFELTTQILPMAYTKGPVPRYVYKYGPPDTLQIYSVKVVPAQGEGLCWPLHVYGLIAVRDSIDQQRNVIFNRNRDDCQTLTTENPYLVLMGPKRSVVMNGDSIPVSIEADLKVKGADGLEDKHLILAAAPLPFEFGSSRSFILSGRSGKLDIGVQRIYTCVEAVIFTRVIEGTWPAGFNGKLVARTSDVDDMEIVLVEFEGDMPISYNGNLDQSRFVISVHVLDQLIISCRASSGNDRIIEKILFKAEKRGRSCATLNVGTCALEILVAWSPIRPVCEELVSMSEMVFA